MIFFIKLDKAHVSHQDFPEELYVHTIGLQELKIHQCMYGKIWGALRKNDPHADSVFRSIPSYKMGKLRRTG